MLNAGDILTAWREFRFIDDAIVHILIDDVRQPDAEALEPAAHVAWSRYDVV
jgi:hypothetical protein